MWQFSDKLKKVCLPGPIWVRFGNRTFSEKSGSVSFLACNGPLTPCKESEKTNEPILRKVGNRQTNGQTGRQTERQALIRMTPPLTWGSNNGPQGYCLKKSKKQKSLKK